MTTLDVSNKQIAMMTDEQLRTLIDRVQALAERLDLETDRRNPACVRGERKLSAVS